MTHPRRRPARAIAISKAKDKTRQAGIALGGLVIGLGLLGTQVFGESHEQAASDETIIVSHAFSDYGQIKYGPDFPHLDYVNPDAPKGGEISFSALGNYDSMNPYSRRGNAGSSSSIPFEDIMIQAADDPYAYYCLLCETLEYPESQEWVIFNLRPEARFADGEPLTAHDVVFTVNLFLEQGLPSFAEGVKRIFKDVEALDDHRVRFTFQPDAPPRGRIGQAGVSVVLPEHWFEETGSRLDEGHLEFAPGSAPYQVAETDVGRSIVYERNPDYWGNDLPISVGRNNFDRIRVEYFGDANAAFEAFKSGVFTYREESSSLIWATQYDFPALEREWVIQDEVEIGTIPTSLGFVFNLRREKFQDPRVREALGLMYNFTWTNNTLQYGLFEQRHSFWENSENAASGVPEGRELEILQELGDLVPPELLTEPPRMAHESGERQLDRANLRRASQLLDEAGWITGDDGIRRKDGQPLEVEILEDTPTFDRLFTPYVQNLERLGIQANYNRVDPAQYTNRRRDFDYDIIWSGYRSGFVEGGGMEQRLGSQEAEFSLFNPAGYASPALDEVIERIQQTADLDEMQALIRVSDRILRYDYPMIPGYWKNTAWLSYYDMLERPEELPLLAIGQLDFWWFNQERYEELQAAGAF